MYGENRKIVVWTNTISIELNISLFVHSTAIYWFQEIPWVLIHFVDEVALSFVSGTGTQTALIPVKSHYFPKCRGIFTGTISAMLTPGYCSSLGGSQDAEQVFRWRRRGAGVYQSGKAQCTTVWNHGTALPKWSPSNIRSRVRISIFDCKWQQRVVSNQPRTQPPARCGDFSDSTHPGRILVTRSASMNHLLAGQNLPTTSFKFFEITYSGRGFDFGLYFDKIFL